MKEKKLRIEDALAATKAAVEEGLVAGGGVALVNVIPAVEKLLDTDNLDEKTGVKIVLKALEEPMRQIAANAGLELLTLLRSQARLVMASTLQRAITSICLMQVSLTPLRLHVQLFRTQHQ